MTFFAAFLGITQGLTWLKEAWLATLPLIAVLALFRGIQPGPPFRRALLCLMLVSPIRWRSPALDLALTLLTFLMAGEAFWKLEATPRERRVSLELAALTAVALALSRPVMYPKWPAWHYALILWGAFAPAVALAVLTLLTRHIDWRTLWVLVWISNDFFSVSLRDAGAAPRYDLWYRTALIHSAVQLGLLMVGLWRGGHGGKPIPATERRIPVPL